MFLIFLDYISILPLVFILASFHNFVINFDLNELMFLLWMLSTSLLVELIKRIEYPRELHRLTNRPEGCFNTDFLSRNGKQPKNTPGFPSGHMAITTLFCYKKISELENSNFYGKIYYSTIILLMGISRYYKKCHNVFQILVGSVFGLISGLVYKIYN